MEGIFLLDCTFAVDWLSASVAFAFFESATRVKIKKCKTYDPSMLTNCFSRLPHPLSLSIRLFLFETAEFEKL